MLAQQQYNEVLNLEIAYSNLYNAYITDNVSNSHYPDSVLSRMFGGKKDVLYSFMSQDNINWRNLIYRIAVKLIAKVTNRKDFKKSHLPVVLICDDSDLPKTGMRMEAIGGLFRDVFAGIHELTVIEKIWAIIVEVVALVAELTGADDTDYR